MITVVMITYGHEKFIKDSIFGVLSQISDYPIELLIANDCSPDGTDQEIRNVLMSHPNAGWITYMKRPANIGMMPNFLNSLLFAKGKYIAICEGDDVWTDPYKLQKQLDFLEANPNFSMCFHDVSIISDFKKLVKQYFKPSKDVLFFRDLVFRHYIPTCSLVFRRDFMPSIFPDWMYQSIVGDIPLELMISEKGPVKYMDEVMAEYRKHSGGVTMNKNRFKVVRLGLIQMYSNLNAFFNYQYWYLFTPILLKNLLAMLKDRLGLTKQSS